MEKNEQKTMLRGREVIHKKVLILGEAGSGKTRLAANVLQELMTLVDPEKITVLDLAPERVGEIGGKLTDHAKSIFGVNYLSPRNVYTPRLVATSAEQVLHYAELNRKIMEPLLKEFIRNPTEILAINDVTMYLHLGELETILKCARLAKTFLATAYYGSRLIEDLGTGISSRERQLTDKLAAFMDLVVKID